MVVTPAEGTVVKSGRLVVLLDGATTPIVFKLTVEGADGGSGGAGAEGDLYLCTLSAAKGDASNASHRKVHGTAQRAPTCYRKASISTCDAERARGIGDRGERERGGRGRGRRTRLWHLSTC